MIVTLAESTCWHVQEVDRLQLHQNSANWIKQTSAAAQILEKEMTQLVAIVVVLQLRLSADDLRKIYDSITHFIRSIKQLQGTFSAGTYSQSKALAALHAEARKKVQETHDLWKQYAEEQTKEIIDLFNLVNHLPEVTDQQTIYNALLAEIQSAKTQAPQTLDQLNNFEGKIEEFSAQLNDIHGLSDQVKAFLQRTLKGEATFADLTDDVLEWCRQGHHAQVFAIRFAK